MVIVGLDCLRSFKASLAQSVERETLNLKVAGSTPAWGFSFVSPAIHPRPMVSFILQV